MHNSLYVTIVSVSLYGLFIRSIPGESSATQSAPGPIDPRWRKTPTSTSRLIPQTATVFVNTTEIFQLPRTCPQRVSIRPTYSNNYMHEALPTSGTSADLK